VVISGQVPAGPDGTIVGAGDPAAQVRQVFTNLATALAAAGAPPPLHQRTLIKKS
jgi:enamine deaminase RidA (YjgF/YER057c/UK114 family)